MSAQDTSQDTEELIEELTAEILAGLEHILQRHADFDHWCETHEA